jgi:hypothetical protein
MDYVEYSHPQRNPEIKETIMQILSGPPLVKPTCVICKKQTREDML